MHRACFRFDDGDAGRSFTGRHSSLILRSLCSGYWPAILCEIGSSSDTHVTDFRGDEDVAVSKITETETFLVQLPETATEFHRGREHC